MARITLRRPDRSTTTRTGSPAPISKARRFRSRRIRAADPRADAGRLIQPVLCGSGREHIGIQPLMDAVCYYLPSPLDRPPVVGHQPEEEGQGRETQARSQGAVLRLWCSRSSPTRTATCTTCASTPARSRPIAGCYNAGRDKQGIRQQALSHPCRPQATASELPEAFAGDIVAIIGPKDPITGDTLCDTQHPILLEQIQFAEAVVSRSIEPESSADKDKLERHAEPAQAARIRRSPGTSTSDTGQTLMSGMGMLHLEVKQHRLERDFPSEGARRQAASQLPRDLAPVDSR